MSNDSSSEFDIDARRGSEALIASASGGRLWETWRLKMEKELHQVNNTNEDRALLEQALRE